MSTLRMGMQTLMACVALTMTVGIAHAEEVPMVTGEQWIRSSVQVKKAYLIGIANAYQVEAAYHGSNPPSDEQSLVPRFGRGLKGHTLDTVRVGLDDWYSTHPSNLSRPVIETIWFEMVAPGLEKNR